MTAPTGPGHPAGLWVRRRPAVDPDLGAVPVVAVHGALDRSASFARLARALPEREVVRYDRRGYGRSRPARPPTGLDDHVDDLVAVVGDRPAVVVGHSVGGLIALTAAARHPGSVVAVLAYEPPTPWAPWWPASTAWAASAAPDEVAERFLRGQIGDAAWLALPPRTRAERRAEGPALVVDLASARHRPFDPAALRCPVVLALGTATDPRHRRGVQALADDVAHAEVAVVRGADHGGHRTHPGPLASLVRRLLPPAPPDPGRPTVAPAAPGG